jgi:hypothetical protein
LDKLERLKAICTLHDEIKNSPIRMAGLEGFVDSHSKRNEYYKLLRKFVLDIRLYMIDFKSERHVVLSYGYCIQKDINMDAMFEKLYDVYAENKGTLGFIAASDFVILSKLHHLIEYMYFTLTGKYWSPEFENRIL